MDSTPHEIYVLRDPRTGEIRYVGISVNPSQRLAMHIQDALPNPKREWLAELLDEDLIPELEVIDRADDKNQALRKERRYIKDLEHDNDLLNRLHSETQKTYRRNHSHSRGQDEKPRKNRGSWTEEQRSNMEKFYEANFDREKRELLETMSPGDCLTTQEIQELLDVSRTWAYRKIEYFAKQECFERCKIATGGKPSSGLRRVR